MSELIKEIVRRCEAFGILAEESPWGVFIYFPEDKLPNGLYDYEVHIEDGLPAEFALSEPFEQYRLLLEFSAMWSPTLGAVECSLEVIDSSPWRRDKLGEAQDIGAVMRELRKEVCES